MSIYEETQTPVRQTITGYRLSIVKSHAHAPYEEKFRIAETLEDCQTIINKYKNKRRLADRFNLFSYQPIVDWAAVNSAQLYFGQTREEFRAPYEKIDKEGYRPW
jgi:hypothetical protein